jgi:hypothetical protein
VNHDEGFRNFDCHRAANATCAAALGEGMSDALEWLEGAQAVIQFQPLKRSKQFVQERERAEATVDVTLRMKFA